MFTGNRLTDHGLIPRERMMRYALSLWCLFVCSWLVGCGEPYESTANVTVEKAPTQTKTEPVFVAAEVPKQAEESEPTESPTQPQESEPEKPVDVREVGPPDPPKESNSKDELNDLANQPNPVDSPLKEIPVPTEEEPEPVYVEKQTMDIASNWTRITPVGKSEIWFDAKNKQVMVAGVICMQRGGLEMFICPFNTKEHESVIAVNARSYEVHTALLATGTRPGQPVQWHPEFKPVSGPKVGIDVTWKDPESGEIKTKTAQQMIRSFRTKKELEKEFIFGGSVMEKDEETGRVIYYGDGGELVCVSNFSTATLDLPIESSQSNDDLIFEANPDHIPEPGTKVYVIFKPQPVVAEK